MSNPGSAFGLQGHFHYADAHMPPTREHSQRLPWHQRLSASHYGPIVAIVIVTIILSGTAVTLWLMGQLPICKCGRVKLWHGIVVSAENSQHLSDWYTPSHVIHGFAFYAILHLLARRWPLGLRLAMAVVCEAAWEVFENTDFTINRYRTVTIALDYYGDSVINSLSDILAMIAGFLAAARFQAWVIIVALVVMEAGVAYVIRDNLLLNILMLIYPIEAVLQWQMGA